MKTETLETLQLQTPSRRVDAHLMLSQVVAPETQEPEDRIFRSTEPGGTLILPDNYMGSGQVELPTLRVETPRGHEALIADLHGTNKVFDKLYKTTTHRQNGKNMGDRVTEMTHSAVLRILDTSGGEGLHHIHKSVYPNPLYHSVKRGSRSMPSIYVTKVGEVAAVPVFGLLTATISPSDQATFVKAVGANADRKRYNH
jgi:hypothetical protein